MSAGHTVPSNGYMTSATHREIPAPAPSPCVPGIALQDCRSASPASGDVYACGSNEQRTSTADLETFAAGMRKVMFVLVEADPVMLGEGCRVDRQLLWLWVVALARDGGVFRLFWSLGFFVFSVFLIFTLLNILRSARMKRKRNVTWR